MGDTETPLLHDRAVTANPPSGCFEQLLEGHFYSLLSHTRHALASLALSVRAIAPIRWFAQRAMAPKSTPPQPRSN